MNIEIDENILTQIFTRVRVLEANNIKTGQYTDSEMVKMIVKIIDSYVNQGGQSE